MDAPSPPVMRIAISPAKARNNDIFLCKIKLVARETTPVIFLKRARYDIASREKMNVAVVAKKACVSTTSFNTSSYISFSEISPATTEKYAPTTPKNKNAALICVHWTEGYRLLSGRISKIA